MQHPPNAKHRASRGKRRKRAKRAESEELIRTVHDPLFGDIPLVPFTSTDANGREYQGFRYDPDYAPPLPKGAVRGDIRKQDFCSMCHMPRYFFVDIERVCVQCGERFVFSAREQKHWYETLKFHFDSTATRCLDCRRSRRSDRAVNQELVDAKNTARKRPEDPAAQLALAEAIVRYFQRRKAGRLEEAIAASRKARRLLKGHPVREVAATLFWEGMSQALAGKSAKARELLEQFVSGGGAGKRNGALAKEAKSWLATSAKQG